MTAEPYDVADYLGSDGRIGALIEAAFDESDPALIKRAFDAIGRAKGYEQLGRLTGIAPEQIESDLTRGGEDAFMTLIAITRSYGLNLQATPIAKAA